MSLLLNTASRNQERDLQRLMRMTAVLRDGHALGVVTEVKNRLALGHTDLAAEAYAELTREEERALWVAPSRGGIWTTAERATMKSSEWRELLQHHRGPEWHKAEENGV